MKNNQKSEWDIDLQYNCLGTSQQYLIIYFHLVNDLNLAIRSSVRKSDLVADPGFAKGVTGWGSQQLHKMKGI